MPDRDGNIRGISVPRVPWHGASTLCPRCGDPPEHVRCHDRECPTRARCCGQGCSRCMREREEADYLYVEDMTHGD